MRCLACILLLCILGVNRVAAQQEQVKPLKIAVFSPIYIDSAFNGSEFDNAYAGSLPKNMLPGLEFYNGVMLAIDSLQKEQVPVEVLVFDSKSTRQNLKTMLTGNVWDSLSLIIACFNSKNDIKELADFALLKNIPLLSSTYPSDGGVKSNPFFIMLNSSLRTHLEGMYKHLQKNYSIGNMVLVTRKGGVETAIQNVFTELGKKAPLPLKYKTVQLTDSFTIADLNKSLDSTRQNIVVCGVLNEDFGVRLVQQLNSNKKYRSVAIGMPTWDGLKALNFTTTSTTDKGIEIVYSTPYNFDRTSVAGKRVTGLYKERFYARPSDWVFKGYESMYHFGHLLAKHRQDLINNLSDAGFMLFNNYDIQPVKSKDATVPDYLENKKLYFVKRQNGVLKAVN